MNLRFNKGAIVVLSIRGLNNPSTVMGKVVNVFPDEVEICPQSNIIKDGDILQNYTLDYSSTLHIRREHIWSWRYAQFYDFRNHENVHYNQIIDKTVLNEYGPDGFCKGSGPSFANIKEISTTNHLLEDDGK